MHGISNLSIIPMRSEPSERSEMVSQLLFGETYEIIDEKEGWLLIRCNYDNYEGWIDQKMSTATTVEFIENNSKFPLTIVGDLTAKAICEKNKLPVMLVKGSLLPMMENSMFTLNEDLYSIEGKYVEVQAKAGISRLEREALSYINSPYLWGGRTPFGIDCSGFAQMVYRFIGIILPRDANEQALLGKIIDFIYEALPGDLAFFDNTAGTITHVGIILGEGQIIHASGAVKIDSIDHNGIFNRQTGKYTHNLRILKRIVIS